MSIKELTKKIEKLPKSKLEEVDHFVDSLLKKLSNKSGSSMKKKKKKIDFSWEGLLADDSKKYTCVELQHFIWEEEMKKYEKRK